MAIPLILCRLKEDHSVVHEIGETALVYFPDWEPVPMEHRQLIEAENNMTAPPDKDESGSAADPAPDPVEEPKADKKVAAQKPSARTKAATAAKEKE